MEKIALSIIAILGLITALKFKGIFHKVISIGITLAILITWIKSDIVLFISYILLLIFAIVTSIYGLKAKELRTIERNSIITMGGFLAIYFTFAILHLPGGGIMKILLLIPIVLTIISYRKHRKLTKEMSFLFFWLVMACIEFANNWI
jgi:hypothetical protein